MKNSPLYLLSYPKRLTALYGVSKRKEYIFLTHKKCSVIGTFRVPNGKRLNLRELLEDVPPLDPLLKEGIEETEIFPNYEIKLKQAQKTSKWHRPVSSQAPSD